MRPLSARQRLRVLGAALFVVAGALWLRSGHGRPGRQGSETTADVQRVAEATRSRPATRSSPSLPPDTTRTAPAPQGESAPRPWVPPQPPPPAQAIKVGDDQPAPSPQPSSAWAIDYRDAICACHTRSCVRDLQGAFARRLAVMVQGDEKDTEMFTEATRAAIRCYAAMPEGS